MRSWLTSKDHALGTEILGTVRAVDESEGKPYIVIGNIFQNGVPEEGEYSFTLSWKNREILTKLGMADKLTGRRIWLKKVNYTTYGYNGEPLLHEGFVIQDVRITSIEET